jgi:hypothetical protein
MTTKTIKARNVNIGQEYWHDPAGVGGRYVRMTGGSFVLGKDSAEVICRDAKNGNRLMFTDPDCDVFVEKAPRLLADIPAGEQFAFGNVKYQKLDMRDLAGAIGTYAVELGGALVRRWPSIQQFYED